METSFISRLKSGWNAFRNRDPTGVYTQNIGPSYSYQEAMSVQLWTPSTIELLWMLLPFP